MAAIRTADELRRLYKAPTERSQRKLLDHLDRHCLRFVELSPMSILATSAPQGRVDVAPRGGEPGFVHTDGAHTLLVPGWPGNTRLDACTGILAGNTEVGLLFVDPGVDETLRVAGTAEIRDDEELRAPFAAAPVGPGRGGRAQHPAVPRRDAARPDGARRRRVAGRDARALPHDALLEATRPAAGTSRACRRAARGAASPAGSPRRRGCCRG